MAVSIKVHCKLLKIVKRIIGRLGLKDLVKHNCFKSSACLREDNEIM